MKVYIVNVNNCEKYPEDYFEENRGVYSSRKKAIDAMVAQGFDAQTKRKMLDRYNEEEYRIEEWEMID